jgi:hypothetical protein
MLDSFPLKYRLVPRAFFANFVDKILKVAKPVP